MSTARNRFGVSILVALILGVLLSPAPARASGHNGASGSDRSTVSEGTSDFQYFGSLAGIASAASERTQVAIALGASVPMLIVAGMVRRRIYAEA